MKTGTKRVRETVRRFVLLGVLLVSVVIANNTGWSADNAYAGETLTILTDMGPISRCVGLVAREWAKERGIEVNWVKTAKATRFAKLMVELQTGSAPYDLVQVQPLWWGDFAPYFLDLSKYVDMNSPWYTDLLAVQNLSHIYEGELKGIQFDGDVLALFYRKDLFENPVEREAFKEKYGYELSPDMTWDQYLDIAEFFTRKPGDKLAGKVLTEPFYGLVETTASWGVHWWFLQRYVAYAGAEPYLFDPDTMEPRINSPAGIKALENFVRALNYAPAGQLGYDWMEVVNTFLNGRCAMIVNWPDIGGFGSNPDACKIIGKIGYALVPGEKIKGKMYRRAWLAHGAALAIPVSSKHPDLAWEFMKYFCGPQGHAKAVIISGTGYGADPVRYSVMQFPSLRDQLVDGDKYFDNHIASLSIGYPDLRIPGAEEYNSILGIYVVKALEGSVSAKEALDEAAREWNKITEARGSDRQREKYLDHIKALK